MICKALLYIFVKCQLTLDKFKIFRKGEFIMKISLVDIIAFLKELLSNSEKSDKFKEIITDVKELVTDVKDTVSMIKNKD